MGTVSCPFCPLELSRKWIEDEHAIAFADACPLTDGHTLVVPRKHVASTYELNAEEQAAAWELVAQVRARLLTWMRPDAFNIGVNDGLAAGQTNRTRSYPRYSPSQGSHPLDHRRECELLGRVVQPSASAEEIRFLSNVRRPKAVSRCVGTRSFPSQIVLGVLLSSW